MKRYIILFFVCVNFIGCGMDNDLSKNEETYKPVEVHKSIDNSSYIDLTMNGIDAQSVTKDNFLYYCYGEYNNGNAKIAINSRKGLIKLENPEYIDPVTQKKGFITEYHFEVFPANIDCVYIMQTNRSTLNVTIGDEYLVGNDVPDLITCVPLYGFGTQRIEVSSIMNGHIAMPSGTYWVKR